MKYAWQIALLIAFAAMIPFIGTGCSLGTSSKLGNTAVIRPDGSGSMTIWMGGTKPMVEEDNAGNVLGSYSFIDYHQDEATYDVQTRIIAQNIRASNVGGVGILQFPADATGFSATYNDYQGHSGSLTVTAGQSTVPVTPNHALNAEAGQQLVIVQVPPALVPEHGQPEKWYENRLDFTVTPTRTIQVKAVMAATYAVGGTTYYMPICPAVTNLAEVPAMDIVLGQGEQEFQFPHLKDLPHPGGTQVYDLQEGLIYALRYFPRLDYVPGARTEGFGFVNTGGQAIQTSFIAYGDAGQMVGSSANLNWPSAGQGAYQAEGVLGLAQATNGWVEARVSRGEMLGFFLTQWFPSGVFSAMDGASVFTRTMKMGVIPRIQMTNGYTTEVRIVNPGSQPISVSIQNAFAIGGFFCGTVPVPAHGMTVLDPNPCGSFDGALYLEAGLGQLIATATIRHGDDCLSTANAIPLGESAETLYASHIVLFPDVYFTTIQLFNGNSTTATATLQPFNADGTPMASPLNVDVPSWGSVGFTDTQLGLPSGASSDGWLKISSPGKPLMGCITFGDPANHRYESTLPLQREGADDFYFAQVATGEVGGVIYGTGLAIVNPSETTPVQVTIEVHKSDGSSNGNTVVRTLAPREKYVRQLSTIEGIGALENQASGYIHVSAVEPVLSFVLFYNSTLDFLSAVQAQR